MKKKVIYLTAFFIVYFGFIQNSTIAFSDDCKITQAQAMERAKKLCKKEKLTYDSILGPYFVLPLSNETRPYYLVYFTTGEIVTGECLIDACKKNRDDICFSRGIRVTDLLLDSTQVKERFPDLKPIFIQLVSPVKFWGPLGKKMLIPHYYVVWWVIDENGDCYYIDLDVSSKYVPIEKHKTSFKALAETRKRSEEDIRTGRLRIIEDSTLQEEEE
jgi:hypothetical protein